MAKPKAFEINFKNVPCEIFGCRNQAKYAIGIPDGHPSLWFKICPDCLKNIVDSCQKVLDPPKKRKKAEKKKSTTEVKEKQMETSESGAAIQEEKK
jgi:hypothetical protein